jgi:serine O-acetyltransferase
VVYRSGERVEPLDHGRLPDSEAQVIRALVDRIEALEQQVQAMGQASPPTLEHELANVVAASRSERVLCRIQDRTIDEFFDGAGI